MWSFVTKFNISWFTGLVVVSPDMSGMSPALLMMLPAWVVVKKSRNLKASALCLDHFITEKPSPGYSTTPLIGVLEYGGTKAATLVPMVLVYCAVSHVPSTNIAALPFSNCWMSVVLVKTSVLVYPSFSSSAHFFSCATLADDVQGIAPS